MLALKIAMRNIFRHRMRSMVSILTIVCGCVAIIFIGGYFEDSFYKMRESYIRALTGHLQVFRKDYSEKGAAHPFDYMIENSDALVERIKSVAGVKSVTKRLEFAGLISTGETTTSCIVQGIEPDNEPVFTVAEQEDKIKADSRSAFMGSTTLEHGQRLRADKRFEVMLGKGLGSGIGAKPGDSLVIVGNTVDGAMNAIDVTVSGIFYTSSKVFDDHSLRIPITDAQEVLRTDKVQSLVLMLDRTEDTEIMKIKLHEIFRQEGLQLEIRDWKELNDFYVKTEQMLSRFFDVLMFIVSVVVVLSIFNIMNTAVLERTQEIGTIRALGTSQFKVVTLFLYEGIFLGVVGGTIGVIVGAIVTYIVGDIGLIMPPPPGATMSWVCAPQVVPIKLLQAFLLSIITAVISALYPSIKASRIDIAAALRHVG